MHKEYLLKKLNYSTVFYIISCIFMVFTILFLYRLSSGQLISILILLFCGIFSALTTYFKRRNEINNKGNELGLNKRINWMIIVSILFIMIFFVLEILIYIY